MRKSATPATLLVAGALMLFAASLAFAHCQIPCGIYTDEMRVHMIREDLDTIEKSMKSIIELSAAGEKNYNQLVRWIDNKEHHAQEIQDLVAEYFLSQRVKAPAATEGEAWQAYVGQLVTLHQITVAAMKAKQSTDLGQVASLQTLVAKFRIQYFGDDAGHSH